MFIILIDSIIIISLISSIVALILLILGFVFLYLHKKKKTNISEKAIENKIDASTDLLSSLFGNKENILEIKSNGSRTSIKLKDTTIIDENKIKETFDEVMFMGNKVVFIIGERSKEFAKLLNDKIDLNSNK